MIQRLHWSAIVLLGLSLLACASGEHTTVDSSSLDHIEPSRSEDTIKLGAEKTRLAVVEEFEERGFQRVESRKMDGTLFLKFKGTRLTETSGNSEFVSSMTIGSVFFARLVSIRKPVNSAKRRVI
jgi:hypothetical protein